MTVTVEEAKPIELDWCCGVNTDIPVVNLAKKGLNHTIGFAANHLVVLQVKFLFMLTSAPYNFTR